MGAVGASEDDIDEWEEDVDEEASEGTLLVGLSFSLFTLMFASASKSCASPSRSASRSHSPQGAPG